METWMKNFLFLILALTVSCNLAYAANHHPNTAYRLYLPAKTTAKKPSYFACFVTLNTKSPTLKKWTPPIEFTNVYLVNYAQNVKGFNGLGILKTTAGFLNSHYFMAYHDADFNQKASGFIDAFVLWAGYQINCNQLPTPKNTTITIKFAGHTYKDLTLAGSDYN
jgi:hypothetical protein